MTSYTAAGTPTGIAAQPVQLTGTWFARVGTRPYELLDPAARPTMPRTPLRTLPRLELAA